ncbi:hypothetical protein MHU86_9956 [Fragilaria crotonensis]|nr:hypothetical protein MHU86_9956 [Fragilaria crotonensis]
MMIFSFANAVSSVLTSGIPCALPYADITLLQVVKKGHVKTNYFYPIYRGTPHRVLVNPGNPADTLQAFFAKNENVLEELNNLAVGGTQIKPLGVKWHVKCDATLTTDLLGPNWQAPRLLGDGIELDFDQSWGLSIIGNVKKRVVAETALERIVNQAQVNWFPEQVIGVITAIYFITGGLSYTGKVKAIARGGAELEAQKRNANVVEDQAELEDDPDETNADTTDAPVAPTRGWKVSMTGSSNVVLTEIDPVDWIVAIEYLRLVEEDGLLRSLGVVLRSAAATFDIKTRDEDMVDSSSWSVKTWLNDDDDVISRP